MSRIGSCWLVCLACTGFFVLSSCAFAQPFRGRGSGGPFGPGGASMFELLMNDQVRHEIELVEDQEHELRELRDKFRDKIQSAMQKIRESGGDFTQMRTVFAEAREEIEAEISDILLDHQLDRLKQLMVQVRMQRGASEALASDEIREKLGLTEEQLDEIRKVATEAQEELRKKILEAQKEAQNKIIGVLTPEQQKIWKELIGEQFSFQNRRPGERGGREQGERSREGRQRRGFGNRPEQRQLD